MQVVCCFFVSHVANWSSAKENGNNLSHECCRFFWCFRECAVGLVVYCASFLWQSPEPLSQYLGAFHDVDKGFRVDAVEHRAQLNHVGSVEGDIYNLALVAFVEAAARDACASSLEVVDDEVSHWLGVVGNDEHGLVAFHSVHHEVYNLALDEDDNYRVDGQPDVSKGDERAQCYDAVNDHH